MQKKIFLALAIAGLFVSTSNAQFADSIVAYTPGAGVGTGYTNGNAVLGGPTIDISYQDGDPFNPPFLASDIIGVGTGGSLTLGFSNAIQNDPNHLFGLDFIIFGHAGFLYGDFPATDGSLFTGGTATVRVSVSTDGNTFYLLNPALAPVVDGYFPNDSAGSPFIPVDPSLTESDFNGLELDGIRALYNGSAGGAGFDLNWAVDESNQSVVLASVNYVRIETLDDVAYIDAVSVVPEPSTWALALAAGLGLLAWKRRANV